MDKDKIIKEYNLNESHLKWEPHVDNWHSVQAFLEQTGKLPNDESIPNKPGYHLQVYMNFLNNKELHMKLLKEDPISFGSMYLSSKRILMRHLDKLNT